LHGNSKKKERAPDGGKDENVFDIQQGVAIALFVKDNCSAGFHPANNMNTARVWHADLWGTREGKYAALETDDASTLQWQQLQPTSPAYLFVPQNLELMPEYTKEWSLSQIFSASNVGVATGRDEIAVGFDSDSVINKSYNFLEDKGLHPKRADLISSVTEYLYRPFDARLIAYDDRVIDRPRRSVMVHLLQKNQALFVGRQGIVTGDDTWTVIFCGNKIEDYNLFHRGNNACLPLYLYPTEDNPISRDQQLQESVDALGRAGGDAYAQSQLSAAIKHLFPASEYPRWPNLDPLLLVDLEKKLGLRFLPNGRGDLTKTFGPEDVFNYIYAVPHCPTYRTRYAEFLKRDFPRIPFTSDRALFAALAAKGCLLVSYHLLESPAQTGALPHFPEAGDNIVERVRYDNELHRVYINKIQYFADVEPAVWNFHVGGYQVCEKWLKDRKGRALTYADQERYQQTVLALRETLRLMSEIDALIPTWPLQ
jgi:predicted helicase